jgi:hypothetical protein
MNRLIFFSRAALWNMNSNLPVESSISSSVASCLFLGGGGAPAGTDTVIGQPASMAVIMSGSPSVITSGLLPSQSDGSSKTSPLMKVCLLPGFWKKNFFGPRYFSPTISPFSMIGNTSTLPSASGATWSMCRSPFSSV